MVWLYVLPGIAAYVGDVWNSEAVLGRLPQDVVQRLADENSTAVAAGFVDDRSIHSLLLSYICCFILILSYQDSASFLKDWRSYFLTASFLFVIFQWPHWSRNFLVTSEGRNVFSLYNIDIHATSFLLQEVRIFGLFLLHAIILINSTRLSKPSLESGSCHENLQSAIAQASLALFRWQFRSAALAFSFMPLSYLYYKNIFVAQDFRYLPSAIMLHMIWFLLWYGISSALFASWRSYRSSRSQYLAEIALSKGDEIEGRMMVFSQMKPTSDLTIVGSAVFTGIAVLAPLLGALFK